MVQQEQLGSFMLKHPVGNLRLSSNISLAASLPCNSSGFQDDRPLDLVAQLTSSSTWVTRAPGYYVSFEFKINGQDQDFEALQYLKESIRGSHVWDQLDLDVLPESSAQPNEDHRSTSFSVRLVHSSKHPKLPARRLHQLLHDVSPADLKPPEGISIASLASVKFSFDIVPHEPKPPRGKRRKMRQAAIVNYVTDEEEIWTAHSQFPQHDNGVNIWASDLGPGSADAEETLNCKLFSANEERKIEEPMHRKGSVITLKRPANDDPKSSIDVSLQTVLELLDAAFRFSIASKPVRLGNGIKVVRSRLKAKLAEIAPGLWSPGYLSNLPQRSCFLPIISRAFSTSIYRNGTSGSLRNKLNGIMAQGESPSIIASNPSSTESVRPDSMLASQLQHNISTSLWRMQSMSLFDPTTARKLSFLKPEDQTGQYSKSETQGILDETFLATENSLATENVDVLYNGDVFGDDLLDDQSEGWDSGVSEAFGGEEILDVPFCDFELAKGNEFDSSWSLGEPLSTDEEVRLATSPGGQRTPDLLFTMKQPDVRDLESRSFGLYESLKTTAQTSTELEFDTEPSSDDCLFESVF